MNHHDKLFHENPMAFHAGMLAGLAYKTRIAIDRTVQAMTKLEVPTAVKVLHIAKLDEAAENVRLAYLVHCRTYDV